MLANAALTLMSSDTLEEGWGVAGAGRGPGSLWDWRGTAGPQQSGVMCWAISQANDANAC